MFLLILVTIGQILKKWQAVFEIQDGGHYHHLEFFQICISDVIDMFQIEVPMFPIGQILSRHLE